MSPFRPAMHQPEEFSFRWLFCVALSVGLLVAFILALRLGLPGLP